MAAQSARCILVLAACGGGLAVTIPAPLQRVSSNAITLKLSEGGNTLVGNMLGDDSTGSRIWDAGRVLSQLMADASDSLLGKRVLELGSGTGVGGLTAAAAGARVTLTDGADTMLPLLSANVRANGLEARADVCKLWWGDEEETRAAAARGPFDLLIGSDLLYAPEAFSDLLDTLAALCTPGQTEVVLTYPPRHTESIFFEQADELFEQIGWTEEVEPGLYATRLVMRPE
jgi:predicted nicotinamide N-methyase